MIEIIKRSRRAHDPYIAPVSGTRGACALCRNYSDLTEDHIPPAGVGNTDLWIARSYLTATTANDDLHLGREFRGGVRFRTLCSDCNSALGGREDKAIIEFFDRVRKVVGSPIVLGPLVRITAKPNLIFRGIMGHLVAANDSGVPSSFDLEARQLFFRRKALRSSSYSLFYWLYEDDRLFIMRNAYHAVWYPRVEVRPLLLVKMRPLAFMFVQEPWFAGLPNLRMFLCDDDDEEIDVPLWLYRRDRDPLWPATALPDNLVILAGDSFGLLGAKA